MNQIEIGKLIAQKRVEKGLTQRQLADFMFVTDKAVSKWERGLSSPDSSLISKLASILNLDMEELVISNADHSDWCGNLILNSNNFFKETIDNKPFIHFLICYFMLVNIKKINIITNDLPFIEKLKLEKYGLEITINGRTATNKIFEINDNFFLYGANLTRHFKYMMSSECNVQPVFNNKPMAFRFLCGKEDFDKKVFGKGYLYIELKNKQNADDLIQFIELLNKYNDFELSNLSEVSKVRNFK